MEKPDSIKIDDLETLVESMGNVMDEQSETIAVLGDELDTATERIATLEGEIDEWKASSMLVDGSGDPDGITPAMNERNITALAAERDAALARAERAEAALRLTVRGLERVAALGEGRVYVDLLDVLAEGRAALAVAKHPAP